jgi:hypothetical protein
MTKRWRAYFVLRGRKMTPDWAATIEFVEYMVNQRNVATLRTADPSSWHSPGKAGDAVEYDWGDGTGGRTSPSGPHT